MKTRYRVTGPSSLSGTVNTFWVEFNDGTWVAQGPDDYVSPGSPRGLQGYTESSAISHWIRCRAEYKKVPVLEPEVTSPASRITEPTPQATDLDLAY